MKSRVAHSVKKKKYFLKSNINLSVLHVSDDIYRIYHIIRGCLDKRFSCDDYARAYKQQQGFTVTKCHRCETDKCNTHGLNSFNLK